MKNKTGKITKILVPVDFSECSKNALEVAGSLVRKLGSSLVVFHAYHVPVPAQQYGSAPLHYDIGDLYAEESDKLKIFVRNTKGLHDIPIEKHVSPSFAHDGILSKVENEDVDLIVMGTTGASGLKDVFIGSITYGIIRESKVPVLSIPPNTTLESGIERVAFGVDCKTIENEACLKPIIALAEAFDADTHIIHVSDKRSLNINQSCVVRDLNAKMLKLHPSFHFEVNSSVEEGLENYVDKNNIDILVLLPRHHNMITRILQKGNTRKVASKGEIPMLTLIGG
ncbi:MAG: universal stress protein [Bacteroidota bacterium]